jgi:TPR repeat protein
MHFEGLGLPKDVTRAIHSYELAACAGEFVAQIELGRIYSRGTDIPTDPSAALKWYSTAAEQEHRLESCEEIAEAKEYITRNT